jgi:hypothetical protein
MGTGIILHNAEHPSQRLAIDIGKHRDPPATIQSDLHPAARRGVFMTPVIEPLSVGSEKLYCSLLPPVVGSEDPVGEKGASRVG